MWNKIKYWIDNLKDPNDEEQEQVHGRRKFLFTLPALVALPKLIEEIGFRDPIIPSTEVPSVTAFISPAGLLSPGPIEIAQYQKEILQMIQRATFLPGYMIQPQTLRGIKL